jgi:hypothetical protein
MDDSRAGPTDEEHKGDAAMHEVNLIVDKLLAVRGTRQTANMQVGMSCESPECIDTLSHAFMHPTPLGAFVHARWPC